MRHFDSISKDGQEVRWARRWTERGPRNWRIVPEYPFMPFKLSDYQISVVYFEVCKRRIREALGVPKEFVEPEQ